MNLLATKRNDRDSLTCKTIVKLSKPVSGIQPPNKNSADVCRLHFSMFASIIVTNIFVGTCAELQQAAVGTATDDIVAELTAEDITCDSWTTFEITTNRLKIVMGEGLADTGRSSFHNVRFMVSSTLRIDFWASFSGDKPEDDEVRHSHM